MSETSNKKHGPKKGVKTETTRGVPQKIRFSVLISQEIAEKVRDVVVFTPTLTLSAAAEEAFSEWLESVAQKFPRGQIPSRNKQGLKKGRPIR